MKGERLLGMLWRIHFCIFFNRRVIGPSGNGTASLACTPESGTAALELLSALCPEPFAAGAYVLGLVYSFVHSFGLYGTFGSLPSVTYDLRDKQWLQNVDYDGDPPRPQSRRAARRS